MPTQLGVSNTRTVVVDGSNASACLTGLSYLVTYSCMVQAGTNLIYFDPSNTINVTVTEGGERVGGREGGSECWLVDSSTHPVHK